MDRVELVYRVEEEFELKMSDEDAEQITTPRQLIDYLMGRPEVSPKWSRDYVALSVWRMVEDELGIDRDDFNEDSRFIEDMGAE
jgi:acyl carrier protein